MFNKVILVGNLTRDMELRYLQSGTALASTGIATNRKFKTSSGEQKEEVMFIDITFFGRTAEVANQYLRKGSKVLVEGRLILEQWTDQNGQKRSKHSITVESMQMLDSRGDMQNQNTTGYTQGYNQQVEAPKHEYKQVEPSYNQPPQTQKEMPKPDDIPVIDIDEDDIPF